MMPIQKILLIFILILSCSSNGNDSEEIKNPIEENPTEEPNVNESVAFYYGADLSYVNEMEDCGALYYDSSNVKKDPYQIFEEEGANLIRIRLWHNPTWTAYSNFNDVKKSIQRAKTLGMSVLLDFHYSDTWTDPSKQGIPAAWLAKVNDTEALGGLLYDYTYETLNVLANENLLPEMVQVGNEINIMILQEGESQTPMNWSRNATLINKGIKAVRDIAKEKNAEIGVMLHIAQPENALWWFEQATQNGITDYDWIGLSYYPIWSDYTLDNVGVAFKTLKDTYKKRLMVVETAYPFTMENNDAANNILDVNALINGYPASGEGQLNYLNKLKSEIISAGGEGLIYWEPAWVSTSCSTLWGQGSHWDNATLFDHNYKPTKGMDFYNGSIK